MAKKSLPVEVNSFVGGIVSDASPLTFPPNASINEANMVLNIDGSRNRRLGMAYESGATIVTTSISTSSSPAHTTFKWENAGGISENTLLVVQFGNEVKFFNLNASPVSSSLIFTYSLPTSSASQKYSYAVVDGNLVVVTGAKSVYTFMYDGTTITVSVGILKVRDLFGVEDVVSGKDLTDSNNISFRPATTTDAHTYNLRNQSFGVARMIATSGSDTNTALRDPIAQFFSTTSAYPSNADAVSQALYPNATFTNNPTADRFAIQDIWTNPIGTGHAAKGYFIIDALDRGTDRMAVYAANMAQYPQLTQNITSLPLDSTAGGPSLVVQFAGRVFYGGFGAQVTSGDSRSPRLSSYILFSQLVQDPTNICKCYQEGDPSSKYNPDLLDTDGGFIRINEAYGITSLKVNGNTLFVLAQNGVWAVTGQTIDSGFTATSYTVKKVSEVGCQGSNSVVLAEGIIYYWSYDGIYAITQTDLGTWVAISLIQGRLQDFYNAIDSASKVSVQGFYDTYEHNIRWVYDNIPVLTTTTSELIFNLPLKAFSVNRITNTATGFPKLTGIYEAIPFIITPGTDQVTVGGVPVVVGVDNVIVGTQTQQPSAREISYVCVTSTTPYIQYTFCLYKDVTFTDWVQYDSVGVDASAFLLTGYLSGGDYQRKKQAPLMTIYCRKSETGYTTNANGDYILTNPSSCLTQAQWEWTNSVNSNRWGKQFQAYRHKNYYLPASVGDTDADGFEVVVTRNKIRGTGRVLSILFQSEPKKDLQLLGWSFVFEMETNV